MRLTSVYILFGSFFLILSCNDVIETDISEETPIVILPQDGSVVPEFATFSWEKMDGAIQYRLQIRTPNFESPVAITYDTTLTKTTINLLLESGLYEYTLIALNNGFESLPAGPFAITADTIQGGQTEINLLAPNHSDFYNNSFEGPFNWSAVPNASTYEFSLREGTNFGTGTIVQSENNISTTSLMITDLDLQTGQYVWGVSAIFLNGNTTSTFTKTFKVDATPPPTPSLISPNNEASVLAPINFTWSNPQDLGSIQSPVTSHIQISSDPNFNTILDEGTTSDESYETSAITQVGTYFWRVRALDEAGNEGDYSSVREFYIN
jgi:hypothetical protein